MRRTTAGPIVRWSRRYLLWIWLWIWLCSWLRVPGDRAAGGRRHGLDQRGELLVEAILPLQREPSHLQDRSRAVGPCPDPHLAPGDVQRRQQAEHDEDSGRQHPGDGRVTRDLQRCVLAQVGEPHRERGRPPTV